MRQPLIIGLLGLCLAGAAWTQPAKSVEELLSSGERLVKERKLDEALAQYREVLSKDPKSVTALYNIGWLYNEQNKFDGAARWLESAVKVVPNDYSLHNELGYSEYKLGNANGAVKAYTRATELKPDSASAWLGLADVQFELRKDAAAAAPAYEKAIANGASGPAPFYRLGWCYNELKQFDKAIPHLKRAAADDPKAGAAWLEWGYSLLRTQKPEDAVQALTRAVALEPKNRLGYLYLGRSYIELGQREKARAQVQALKAIDAETARQLDSEVAKLGK